MPDAPTDDGTEGNGPQSDGPAADPKARDPRLDQLWPALGSTVAITDVTAALPDPEIPLAPLLEIIVPGAAGPTWAGRHANLARHFRDLAPEFGGAPRLAHLLGCVIVTLRRQPENPTALRLFQRITAEHGSAVAEAMNLRWLTSVCDTFCDVGTPVERAAALGGSLVANLIKLAETERRMFAAPRPWPPATKFNTGGALFDGVIAYWVGKGDMIDNLLERAERVLADPNPAAPFVHEVLIRVGGHNTVLKRMISINDGRTIPLADPKRIEAARRVMRDL